MKKIHVITGQTATGKTSYAIDLAKKINGELINCDSRQIYKNLDIITGKDTDKTTGTFQLKSSIHNFDIGYYTFKDFGIPIWLYDIVHPDKAFSTFDFKTCAVEVIQDIFSRNKTPIIVGGTYFYLKHLLYGTVEIFVEPNEILRSELNNKTVADLQNILKEHDEELFNNLNNSEKYNPHRLIRKIEIQQNKTVVQKSEPSLKDIFPDIGFEITGFEFSSKEFLKENIKKRVEERLTNGAIDEVKHILETYSKNDPGLKTIGYAQIISYLDGNISADTMKTEWITKEIQYAKRQLTFMKQNKDIAWHQV